MASECLSDEIGSHLVLVGPTASGKSRLAHALALSMPGVEIVSVDSMCVYRHMDIATAKPSPGDRREVEYHMVDIVDPDEEYTVSRYQTGAMEALRSIESRGERAILVGGTGLYVRSLTDGLTIPPRWPQIARDLHREMETQDGPERLYLKLIELDSRAAAKIDPRNKRRIVRALEVTIGSGRPFSSYGVGLESYPGSARFRIAGIPLDRDSYASAIAERFQGWMDAGLLDEARTLLAWPGGLSKTARQALGYKELFSHIEDGIALDEAVEHALARTREFARRQWRWFRRDPRVCWMDVRGDLLDQLRTLWSGI
ncbi:MAG: tRNA (adenosine(37)-N6)-dimethylallyltransferase MiaA [Acidimicrobiales bacterium]